MINLHLETSIDEKSKRMFSAKMCGIAVISDGQPMESFCYALREQLYATVYKQYSRNTFLGKHLDNL